MSHFTASKFSAKSADNLIDNSLYMMISISLTAFKIVSFECLIIMCLGVGLLEFILQGFIELPGYYIHVLQQIWGFFSHYFFKYSLCPFLSLSTPSRTPRMHMLVHLIISHRSLNFCSLFFHLSTLFLSLNSFHRLILKFLVLFSASHIFLWIPLVDCSFQLVYFSSPEFLLGFF